MKSFFRDLFVYNYHFNQKLAKLFNENSGKISGKSISLFSHTLNAHQIWNNRIEPKQPLYKVWDTHPVESFEKIDAANYEHSLIILDKFELDVKIDYSPVRGKVLTMALRAYYFT